MHGACEAIKLSFERCDEATSVRCSYLEKSRCYGPG